jgi:hypothetical protein
MAAAQPRQLVHLLAGKPSVPEHPPGDGQQHLPRVGQRHPCRSTTEQFRAQISLQCGDLPAQRGLGEEEFLGSPGEMAHPGHGLEGS